jgi:hypothetical protein
MEKPSFEYPQGFFSSYHSQKPICGVLAVAIAAGVTYDVACQTLTDAMKKVHPDRQRFGGKTSIPQRNLALKMLGVKFEETCIVSKKPKLIDAIKDFEPGAIYLVVTPKHVQAIRDGYLIDQGRLQRVELCPQAKKHVSNIIKIIGKGW